MKVIGRLATIAALVWLFLNCGVAWGLVGLLCVVLIAVVKFFLDAMPRLPW